MFNFCPVGDPDCPYYDEDEGTCFLENPKNECDDYYACVGDDEEEEE